MAQTREFISCSNENDVLAATADQILRTKENRPLSIRYRRDGVTRDTLADVTKMPGTFRLELPLEIPQDILDARRFDRVYLSEQTLERGGDTGDLKRPEKKQRIDYRFTLLSFTRFLMNL